MKTKRNILLLITLIGFSNMTLSRSITGKVVINQTTISGSSSAIVGNDQVKTDKREVGMFNKLSILTMVDVDYFVSDKHRLELTADSNIISIITSKIKGDTLYIDANKSYSTQNKMHVKVYGPVDLQVITVEGSSDVNLQGITGDHFEINLSGTSNIKAQGKIQSLLIKTSGSSDANTKELLANDVTIITEGSGDAIVTANKNLDVKIDGISTITYFGHPTSVKKKIDGIGEVLAGD